MKIKESGKKINEKIKKQKKKIDAKKEKTYFAEYLTASIMIGMVCGAVGSLFNLLQYYIQKLRTETYGNTVFLILMPVLGVLMVYVMKLLRQEKHGGTAVGIKALQDPDTELEPEFALGAFVSLSLTNLAESSMVKEAGAFQMTIPAAHFMCNKFYKHVEKSVAAACAVAAGFSAIWGLPVFGTFFAAEIAHGQFRKKSLIWGFISAIFAYPVSKFIFPSSTGFDVPYLPSLDVWVFVKVTVLAVGMGLFARFMCFAFYKIGRVVRIIKNPYIRIAAGGCIGAVVCLVSGHNDFLCGFNDIMASAFRRELITDPRIYYAFAVKFVVFTILKKSGYKTGKLIQTWSIGVLLGELVGGVAFGLTAGFGAMIGMLTLFAATYNTPLAAIALCMEAFPGITDSVPGIIYFFLAALAVSIARIVSGNCKLYYTQDLGVSAKEEWRR